MHGSLLFMGRKILCVILKSKRRECFVLRKRYEWWCDAENAFVNNTVGDVDQEQYSKVYRTSKDLSLSPRGRSGYEYRLVLCYCAELTQKSLG